MNKGELLRIETSGFVLSIVGPLPLADSFALRGVPLAQNVPLKAREVHHLALRVEDGAGLETNFSLLRVECRSPQLTPPDVAVTANTSLPLFFENIDYNVQLSSAPGRRFRLTHAAPEMTAQLVFYPASRSSGANQSGTFNFGANVGQTVWQIVEEVGGQDTLTLGIEASVFSSKIDFLRDRAAMLRDLSRVHHALVFRLLRPTRGAGASGSGKSLGIEWLSSFAELAHDVTTTAARIERAAQSRIVAREEIVAPHQIRRPSGALNRQIERRGVEEVLSKRSLGLEVRRVRVDTPENRHLKFLMRRLAAAGGHWLQIAQARTEKRAFLEAAGGNGSGVQLKLQSIRADLRRMERDLKRPFWQEVGDPLPRLANKTTFLLHPLFVRFEKLTKVMGRAIKAHQNGARWMATLSMEQLYEAWAYLKIVEIAEGLLTGKTLAVLQIAEQSADAFDVMLQTGKTHRIRLAPGVFLCAQRTFRRYPPTAHDPFFSPLVVQKPDLLFEIESGDTLHLLDAKYRLDVKLTRHNKTEWLSSAGLVAQSLDDTLLELSPKDEDINVMHRYRDAILRRGPENPRAARYGLILYPHKITDAEREEVQAQWQLLHQFEIGAVPLSPGESDQEWLAAQTQQDWVPSMPETEQVRVLAAAIARMLNI